MTLLEKYTAIAQEQIVKRESEQDGASVEFGKITMEYVDRILIMRFVDCKLSWKGEEDSIDSLNYEFTCAHKTPKGYISSKSIGIEVIEPTDVTDKEAEQLLQFVTDAKKNTFDPFYAENQANRSKASALNYIAKNFITDPYCTR